ncbi:hypothetical protein LSTR_LSTR006493 [Laodelphax striatellus]|uniref:C2H2-type domain-containing protein n=1 Tax=Laodelphax striatellus TaxID=195883 RepID=A0A482WX47_LAOST|nr:hypothetical protein LSTR_LSTR006493 [Laodelphax striatellus]
MANSHNGGSKCTADTAKANNAYEAKFQEMQKYIPFLEKMIQRLQRTKGGTREHQLAKMKSLYTILSDGKHRYGLTLESLEKCDSILRNLYQKVKGEEEDLVQQSLSPKNSDGKPVLPSTTATKAKENEPNPSWVLGSPNKPPSGFKKNFKKQRSGMGPGPHQSTASQSDVNQCPHKQANKQKATKLCSKISDLKSGKIKTNVMKHGCKVSSPPRDITSPPKEDSSVGDHNKSVVNQPKKHIVYLDQKKSIENSSQHSCTSSNQDRSVSSSPLTPHSSTNRDKKKETVSSLPKEDSSVGDHNKSVVNQPKKHIVYLDQKKSIEYSSHHSCSSKKKETVSSPIMHHSTKSSKQIGNTTAVQHSSSDLEKKKVCSSSVKQHSTSNLNENKRLIPSPVTSNPMLNAARDKPIPGSSIIQHSAPKSNVGNQTVESQVKPSGAKNSGQDVKNVSSTSTRHPQISSDKCSQKRSSTSGVGDRPLSTSQSLLSHKRTESDELFNVSDKKKLSSSSSIIKASNSTKSSSTTVINSSDAITKPSSTLVSDTITKPSSTSRNASDCITKPSTLRNASETVTKASTMLKNVSDSSTKPSTLVNTSETITKPSSTVVNTSETITKPSSTVVNTSETITKPSLTLKNVGDSITKPSSTSSASHSPTIKPNEPTINKSTATVSHENKPETRDDMKNSPSTFCDQHPQKRPVPLPSPKDPRLARGLLTKSVLSERWERFMATNPLQGCKIDLKQENVPCKTEPKQETGKPEQSQSLRAKLAEEITTVHKVGTSVGGALRAKLAGEITTVHKVGTSVGGALRTLTKNMSSIEQNRIANLKPGTIIDLMDKELPKPNKKSKQNKLSDQQNVKTNQSTNTTSKSTLSTLSKDELEKLVVKNIHNLPALPPDTKQMLEMISNNTSQSSPMSPRADLSPGSVCKPVNDQATNLFDSSQTSRTNELHNKSDESLIYPVKSEEDLDRFDSCQNFRPSELCRVEVVNSDQTSNRLDSRQTSRPTELYARRTSSKPTSDQATNRFDSCQNSRTSEFYDRGEGVSSNSVFGDQASNRFDPNFRSNELYSRLERPAANYSNWENPALDSIGMSTTFRIQSPSYNQTNSAHDTSSRNHIYNRNTGLSSPYDPSISGQSENDNSSLYGMNYYRDPRRRSLEQADCRSPEAEDWKRVIIHEDRSRFTPDYSPNSDSVWSGDENSRLPSRYHQGNMSQYSTQYGRTLMTCRSNSSPSSGRRLADHRFSPERTTGRFSNSRSSLDYSEERRYSDSRLDYPEERKYSDSRLPSERRVSEARLKRYRDYNEPFPDRPSVSDLEHERVHLTSRSSHDRSFNTSSAERYNSYSNRSGLSQEREYSDSRVQSRRRDRSSNRRDTFSSPLDQLYSETRGPVTGRGYGVQNFRHPRSKPKESDLISKRKMFDKNSSKSIENDDDSSFEKSSSKEMSHSREASTFSQEKETNNEEIEKKSPESNVNDADKILITASNFVEERKVILLLDKSDTESNKDQGKTIASADASFDSEKVEGDVSEVNLTPETRLTGTSGLLERSDDPSMQNLSTEIEEKQSVNNHSDSIATKPEILGEGTSENQSFTSKKDTASNVDRENTRPMSALTDPDISIGSTKKSESVLNENSEISHEDKKEEEKENKNKVMDDNEKNTSAKPNSADQKSKDEIPTMISTCLGNINSDESLPSNTQKEINDNLIEVDLSDKSEILIEKESTNDNQHCKIEEPFIKEEKESSNSGFELLKKPISDAEDQKSKAVQFLEVLMKNSSLQTEESEKLIAKLSELNPEKLSRKIQQIFELSDEEDNVDSKDDIKPDFSQDKGLENDGTTVMDQEEHNETSSNKRNDASSNNNSKDLKSSDNQLFETNEETKQYDANRKKTSPAKRTRTSRGRSSKKLEIPDSAETSQEFEKGKRKWKSELDRLHDGLREMFLKAEIEKTSGIRSCRLRNVTVSPETSNREKIQKENGSTKDGLDDSGKDLEDKEETKDNVEHENDKVEGSSQVKLKDSLEDKKHKDSEETTCNSSSSSSVDNNDDSASKLSEANNSIIDQNDERKSDDDQIKSMMMSSGSFRSTPIVLLQKSNVLMSNKPFPSQNSSSSTPVAKPIESESSSHEQDKAIQQPHPSAASLVISEKVDDSHAPEKAVGTDKPSPPKKSKKVVRKKHLQEDLNKNQSANIERNPVILLEKRDLIELVGQTNNETEVSSNDITSTDPAIQSDNNKNDTSIELSSSHADMGKVTFQKRPTLSDNIFTDKSYYQKTSSLKTSFQFECKICNYFGRSIVIHYVTEHSDQDVLISRLETNDAKEAIMKSNNEEINKSKPSLFKCYMCSRTCTLLSSFYDHITSHTGEYRYHCQLCPFKVSNRHAAKTHCTSTHSLDWRSSFKTAIVVDPIPDMLHVFGFICSDCNFVQLKQSTVEEHVKNHHNDASDVKIIRINMSSLEPPPAPATDKNDSYVLKRIPPTDVQDDSSNGNFQENREIVLNVGAFSSIEPINDFGDKRSIMREILQNIERTIFMTQQTTIGRITGKIGELSDLWESISGNDQILPQADNTSQNVAESNIQSPPQVSESQVLAANSSNAAAEEIEVMNFEEDQLDQVDETTILEEIKIASSCLEDDAEDNSGDNNSMQQMQHAGGFGVCTDESSKINCLLDRFQREHKDNEGNENSGDDRDDFENEEVRDGGDVEFFDLISKTSDESSAISKVDLGPLTISRSKERVTFSCNLDSCHFRSFNPKYIVCHFGNHLTSSSKLSCSCCNEEFDSSLDAVGLMKGIVKHGLEHVLPPPLPSTPPTPQVAGTADQDQCRKGFIRVRRLSGDQLSSFVNEVDNNVAGPSSSQQLSASNDSFGNLRIESVVSAANCDAATLHALTSLHDDPSRRRRRNEETAQLSDVKFLIDFYKCMGDGCKFTTNDCSAFKDHLKQSHARKRGSWHKCVYCLIQESCMTALIKHMHTFHANSVYQCAHCFYRSVSKSNVIYHQNSEHVSEAIKIYHCKKIQPSLLLNPNPASYLLRYSDIIRPYKCIKPKCVARSFLWEVMEHHILQHGLRIVQCQECSLIFDPEKLRQHHLEHDIGHYQCTYCAHATATAEDMRGHQSNCHPDLTPKALLRELKRGDIFNSLFLDTSPIDFYLKQLRGIFLNDLNEPEGSVIDCTEFDPTQDQENELSGFDERMWAQAQMFFEPPSRPPPQNTKNICNRPVPPAIPLKDLFEKNLLATIHPQMSAEAIILPNSEPSASDSEHTEELAVQPTVPFMPREQPARSLENTGLKVLLPRRTAAQLPMSTAPVTETIVISSSSEDENSERVAVNSNDSIPETRHITHVQPQMNMQGSTMEPILISSESEAENEKELSNNLPTDLRHVKSESSPTNGDFMCFLCNKLFDTFHGAVLHVTTTVHNVAKIKVIPYRDCTSDSVVRVIRSAIVVTETSTKSSIDLKTKFAMNEVELLPKKAILSSPIHCDHCGFSNVVVKNMKIHLQNHASGKEVSTMLLVNPVPCLERNEKMFDKMVNLAGSSHSQPAKTSDHLSDIQVPKFVMETNRYTCCVCNYLAINDQMLFQHITTLHHDTSHYKCPHCANIILPLDKITLHLRMHDVRMYRCSYCAYYHYQRHLVSKHLSEKHPEKKQFVQIVRDPDPVEDGFKSTEDSGDEFKSSPKSLKMWQCKFCYTYKIKESQIREHCKTTHGIEERYKCCFCAHASDSEDSVRDHFKTDHINNNLHIAEAFNRVCLFSPLQEMSSVDFGLLQRRERNLRDNIRGITFEEPSSSRRAADNYGVQTLADFKCPECGFLTKDKAEFKGHIWTDYYKVLNETLISSKKFEEIELWIDLVTQMQEEKIYENLTKVEESCVGFSKNTTIDELTRPKKLQSRKRSLSRGYTASDSSDDSGDYRKPKKTRQAKPRYECGYCSYQCFLVKSMEKHHDERHPGKTLRSHPVVPKSDSVYECQICGRLDHKDALLEHFRLTHPSTDVKISFFEGEVFKCNHCGHVDASYARLTAHSSDKHQNMPVDVITVEKSNQKKVVEIINHHPYGSSRSSTKYACSSCKAIFNAQKACELHIRKEHQSRASITAMIESASCDSSPIHFPSTSKNLPQLNGVEDRESTPSPTSMFQFRGVAKKKTATIVKRSQVAKKSTSKVRRVDDQNSDDKEVKIYPSTVVLNDLRNTPQQ